MSRKPPTQIGVYDLRNQLSKILAAVEAGESFEVVKHKRPVARLTPVDPQPDPGTIADRVLAARRRLNRTPGQAAYQAGLDEAIVRAIEAGTVEPDADQLGRLAKALGVDSLE